MNTRWAITAALLAAAVIAAIGIGEIVRQGSAADQIRQRLTGEMSINERLQLERQLLADETDARSKTFGIVVRALGAIVLVLGAFVGYRNLLTSRETLKATQAKLEVDREAQITNRFTQAIGQLGAELSDGRPNLEVRLGGIYALERIAKDSPPDLWTIAEVLTAYVRNNAPSRRSSAESLKPAIDSVAEPPKPRADVQAILTVLGRMSPEGWTGLGTLDLAGTDLARVDLEGAHLDGARFLQSNLQYAKLSRAKLEHASFIFANLASAFLDHAEANQAVFQFAYLDRALFTSASLQRAAFGGANGNLAYFPGADLRGADFTDAELESA